MSGSDDVNTIFKNKFMAFLKEQNHFLEPKKQILILKWIIAVFGYNLLAFETVIRYSGMNFKSLAFFN